MTFLKKDNQANYQDSSSSECDGRDYGKRRFFRLLMKGIRHIAFLGYNRSWGKLIRSLFSVNNIFT